MAAIKETQKATVVDLGTLLDAGDNAVVTLVAGDTRLVAHRAVLATRSPVFGAMLQDMLEGTSDVVTVADVEGPVLRQLLSYLYTLQAPQLPNIAPQLLAAADRYGVSGLKAACEQQLTAQLAVENAAAAAVLAVRHSCLSLKEAAISFIKANSLVLKTRGWADAVLSHPKDVVEVSRLIGELSSETSVLATTEGRPSPGTWLHNGRYGQTSVSAALHTTARHSPPPDDRAVSRLRSLSREEKGEKLIRAAFLGNVKKLRPLLAAGADVSARDSFRNTALHFAATRGDMEAVRLLVEAGAEVDARDSIQVTPLHKAAGSGRARMVRLLLAFSADCNARTCSQETPLHIAAERGHSEVVALLLEAGANRLAMNNRGSTPLDLARMYNHQEVIDLLT